MKKIISIFAVIFALVLFVSPIIAAKPTDNGFDEFGYNKNARIFNGTGMSWCMGKIGDQTYCDANYGPWGNDKLIMKWNADWDRGNLEKWANPPYYAWENNEWNGMKDGSGEVWHYKIVWVGPCTEGKEFPGGGYCLWGQFKVLSDHGKDADGHTWLTHAIPNGYGAYKWNQVDSFVVPADSVTGAVSNIILNTDSKYLIKVAGTGNAGDTIDFDAEYSVTDRIDSTWRDSVAGYEGYGPDLLDLMVNGGFVNWGPFNTDHTYFYYMTGNGSQLSMMVNDIYPSNNTGFLTVTVFEQK